MPKITKRVVDATPPTDKPTFVWDDQIKGFGLLVLPSGVKSYIYQYRSPEGRSRRATIGKHGPKWTAEQARKAAEKMQTAVRLGQDPLGEKQAQRNALTVEQLLDKYMESARFAEKAELTQTYDRGRIKRHLVPTLGKKFVDKLTAEDVRRAFASIRDGKTAIDVKTGYRGRAIVKGGEGAARMAIRLLRAAINWAKSEGLAKVNAAEGVKIGNDSTRDTILGTADQYAAMFRALDTMTNEKRLREAVADAIRVIALTGARRNEIAALKWSHVDLRAGVLVLPPNSHKTGHKTGKPKVIGLPAAAQAIIARQPTAGPDDFVFPPAHKRTKDGRPATTGPISLSKPWAMVRSEAGLPDGIGLHGLRHSMASHLAMNGAAAAEIMTALGHRQLSTAQRYIHWQQDARAALAEKAAAHVVAAMEPRKAGQGCVARLEKVRSNDQG